MITEDKRTLSIAVPPATMEYPYQTVDVFTATRFGGNPLAVVTDARGLSEAQMQQIAAEFHYSETTFVLPPTRSDTTARVRIFTPTAEVPEDPATGSASAALAAYRAALSPLADVEVGRGPTSSKALASLRSSDASASCASSPRR